MFLDNKYSKWYNNIIQFAKSQNRKKKQGIYYENHHIVPKSMGGIEKILLTAKEHYICHLLLPNMLIGKEKYVMINALVRMSFSRSKGQERHTARSYSIVKAFIAEKNRWYFKGKIKTDEVRANMKGRCGSWIRTEEQKQNQTSRLKTGFGKNNGFFGKTHSEETKRNWSILRKGSKPPFTGKGMKWFTNGTIDIKCPEDKIPDGYYHGRTKRWSKQVGMAEKKSPA